MADEYGNNTARRMNLKLKNHFHHILLLNQHPQFYVKYLFERKLSGTILRPFIIYGPGRKKQINSYVINKSLKNETFEVSSGNQIRDFLIY